MGILVDSNWMDCSEKAAPLHRAVMRKHDIPDQHEAAFIEFVETGDVQDDDGGFLAHFESDKACQLAVEESFDLRLGELQEAIRSLGATDIDTR